MAVAQRIDGKAAAEQLHARVSTAVARLVPALGRAPGLAVVRVGEDPASAVYVRTKLRQTTSAGMVSIEHHLPETVSTADVLAVVGRLNADPAVDGILVQLPLPAPVDAAAVIAAIDPAKDVDGFHVVNAGRLATGQFDQAFIPCTPLGCLILLRATLGSLSGLSAVVIGRSNIVGKPMAHLLLAQDCTVTLAHSRSRDQLDQARRHRDRRRHQPRGNR
jgi:methylenetetrahydrofolate dehydrogenase (NADP+)/methenyltetrahydrofolate cyclohydrolase